MPPLGGKLTVELRIVHRRSRLLRGVGRVVPTGAVLQADRARARFALHKRRVRPPWRREENRMKNFDWVILLGHSKTNFDPQDGGAV